MARLFITPREIDLISDLTKEVVKDVIGQKIFYYSISVTKTQIHEVYEESPEKVFETPLELDALVTWQPEEVKTKLQATLISLTNSGTRMRWFTYFPWLMKKHYEQFNLYRASFVAWNFPPMWIYAVN